MRSIIILPVLMLILFSCKKDALKETPVAQENPRFSGVVFIQLRTDSLNFYNYGVKKVVAPMTGAYLLPQTGGNGVSHNVYDSMAVNFHSGDSIHVGAWKDGNEPYIENPLPGGGYQYVGPYSNVGGNPHFKIRAKLYFNGTLLHDTISINGQYWFKRLP